MDDIGLSCGVPTFIEEITQNRDNFSVGLSVCVTGKLVDHDINAGQATLLDPTTKHEMSVDTSLIEPFEAKLGSLFTMIGELESSEFGNGGIVLKARVIRCVDGIDMTMYRKAIECQRTYLSKRNG